MTNRGHTCIHCPDLSVCVFELSPWCVFVRRWTQQSGDRRGGSECSAISSERPTEWKVWRFWLQQTGTEVHKPFILFIYFNLLFLGLIILLIFLFCLIFRALAVGIRKTWWSWPTITLTAWFWTAMLCGWWNSLRLGVDTVKSKLA